MSDKSIWMSLKEVVKLSEVKPNQNIWCINKENYNDFIMTAKDIKDTIGNFEWTGWSFGIIANSYKEEIEDTGIEESCENPEPLHQGMLMEIKTASKVISDLDVNSFEKHLNQFLNNDDLEIVNIHYQPISMGTKVCYTALIVYRYSNPA